MKCGLTLAFVAVLLLCFAGCTGSKPLESPADDDLLSAEELLGTYDISYQSDTEIGSRTADLRLLNDRLTFVVFPDKRMDSDHSFDSYDPKTGEAQFQRTHQDERGEFIIYCMVTFTETDGTICVSGNYTLMLGDAAEVYVAFSGEIRKKL